jgi:hypothetical protein
MTRADELFSRQAAWQRSRRSMSWPEKIREAGRVRTSLEAFRRMREKRGATPTSREGGPGEPGAPHDE